jgi:hypothetical protein
MQQKTIVMPCVLAAAATINNNASLFGACSTDDDDDDDEIMCFHSSVSIIISNFKSQQGAPAPYASQLPVLQQRQSKDWQE